MDPIARFGGGTADTFLHPLVALAMLIAIVCIFVLPRRYVVVPLLLAVFLVPLGQVVVLAGIHFTVLRIATLFGLVRALLSKRSPQIVAGGLNIIDKMFFLWAFFYSLNFVLLWMEPQALIQRLGFLVDSAGMYFMLRSLIHDEEDIHRVLNLIAAIAFLVALGMIGEQLTDRNVFGVVGGVAGVPEIRDGRIRSQASFQHSILAGTFGATLLPLFFWLWKEAKSKIIAVLGVISSTIIVLASGSSTPVLAYVAGIAALSFWPLRKQMRLIRWGIVCMLVGLHLVMKAPVWALIARIDVTGSSSGGHRFMLVDNFIRNFSSWWLLGTKNFGSWGWDMADLSNQYVAIGLLGGLISLVFFIAVISRGFARLGTARKVVENNRTQQWLVWSLGAALFAHVVAYFGVSYWDQTQVAWSLLLAIISAATFPMLQQPVVSADLQNNSSTQNANLRYRRLTYHSPQHTPASKLLKSTYSRTIDCCLPSLRLLS